QLVHLARVHTPEEGRLRPGARKLRHRQLVAGFDPRPSALAPARRARVLGKRRVRTPLHSHVERAVLGAVSIYSLRAAHHSRFSMNLSRRSATAFNQPTSSSNLRTVSSRSASWRASSRASDSLIVTTRISAHPATASDAVPKNAVTTSSKRHGSILSPLVALAAATAQERLHQLLAFRLRAGRLHVSAGVIPVGDGRLAHHVAPCLLLILRGVLHDVLDLWHLLVLRPQIDELLPVEHDALLLHQTGKRDRNALNKAVHGGQTRGRRSELHRVRVNLDVVIHDVAHLPFGRVLERNLDIRAVHLLAQRQPDRRVREDRPRDRAHHALGEPERALL